MKIFNSEDGRERVYVQLNDIMFIMNETDIPILGSIVTKVLKDSITIVDNSNRFQFVEFDESKEVEFFRKIDWIIDYNEFIGMDEYELDKKARKVATEDIDIVNKYNSMSVNERRNNSHLVQEHELKVYKIQSFKYIYALKHNNIEIDFPEFMKKS